MGHFKYKDDLDVEEDLRLLRWEWFLERVSWGLMFLIWVATVLGFTGRGGMGVSQTTAGGPETSFEVRYDEYLREEATTAMLVIFHEPGAEIAYTSTGSL
ncbi:hypothetical protein CLV24_10819 [Pontibacter ummariensis]|uniref:Uncharacterized protein n=1 Tax=Pontibacter ummariensis TaxID=1610492 RepID=A0A239FHA1_9BACT|nr:hypothetical protein [Pontibacter ummariensis]PRY12276.1 hypothetical protein CLV24_10819 [Pontibacter ummariensis]SNS55683.1 hypothetical protein SAMN06296052_108166 [Pontibacter ummariensis]